MKSQKYIQWITALGLVVIFALQAIWLRNTYMLIKNDIYKECNSILDKTLIKEISFISNNMPKGFAISGGSPNDSISVHTYLYDSLWKMGFTCSITRIDSIAGAYLRTANIDDDFIICTVNPKTQSILKKSKSQNISTWGIVKSNIIPTRLDMSEGMQLILVNPYFTILERMGLLIIATALMAFFVVGCIIYQIRIINKQKKIAQVREDFSYAMIHDMKTPLTSITTVLSFLHYKGMENKPEMREKYINIAEKEANHLLALANKVLTLSKLENHKLTMKKKNVKLAPIIENLIENFTTNATKPVRFITDLKAEEVCADEEYLAEALSNLIDNAIKYSKETVEIRISSSEDKVASTLKVWDNGLGISEENKDIIFNKFERAAASKRSRKGGATGFGLGLNFVQQVISAHEGGITVNSIEGEFSEFVIHLPLILDEL